MSRDSLARPRRQIRNLLSSRTREFKSPSRRFTATTTDERRVAARVFRSLETAIRDLNQGVKQRGTTVVQIPLSALLSDTKRRAMRAATHHEKRTVTLCATHSSARVFRSLETTIDELNETEVLRVQVFGRNSNLDVKRTSVSSEDYQ